MEQVLSRLSVQIPGIGFGKNAKSSAAKTRCCKTEKVWYTRVILNIHAFPVLFHRRQSQGEY